MILNQRLKQFIEIKNLSRGEFADVINLHPTSVSKWTEMKQEFPLKHLVTLCKAFPDLNVRWLLTGTGPILMGTQDDHANIANKPTSPYASECTNPICIERIRNMTAIINALEPYKKWFESDLARKEQIPEKHDGGGVAKNKKAG